MLRVSSHSSSRSSGLLCSPAGNYKKADGTQDGNDAVVELKQFLCSVDDVFGDPEKGGAAENDQYLFSWRESLPMAFSSASM